MRTEADVATNAARIALTPAPVAAVATAAPACVLEAVGQRDLAAQVEAWDRLAQTATEPNPFFESWYLLPSLKAHDPRGRIRTLHFEHDGRLAGLLPLARSASYYGHHIPHLANWLHDNSFFGAPLVTQGREEQFWRAALDWADCNAGTALFLHLSDIDLEGPLFASLQALLSAQDRPGWIVRREQRAIMASSLDTESYRAAAFSANRRKDLRRRLKRLGDLGDVRFVWQDDDDGIAQWCEQFFALEASGWKGAAGSALAQAEAKRAVFSKALAGAANRGRLLRLALHLNGQPVAMLSTFLTPPGAFGYKTAFDEQYGRYAPGILLEKEFMAALDAKRFAWCDSCAAPDHLVMNDLWQERRTIGKISIAIGGPVRRKLFNQIVRFEKNRIPAGGPA
jgi:CelD/BcsL family acetyltransferase involved in cellulose biosynthesis